MHTPMDNHPQEIIFHEYLDDELPSSERENFESHLSKCQKCEQALSTLQELITQIESLSPFEFTNDISHSVVEEINHIINIEPLIKRTAWVQISIVFILMAILLPSVSIESLQSSLSNILNSLGMRMAMIASAITEFNATLPDPFSGFEVQFFHNWDLFSFDFLSINLLLVITAVTGFMWLVGNRILLPNPPISHSSNGG